MKHPHNTRDALFWAALPRTLLDSFTGIVSENRNNFLTIHAL